MCFPVARQHRSPLGRGDWQRGTPFRGTHGALVVCWRFRPTAGWPRGEVACWRRRRVAGADFRRLAVGRRDGQELVHGFAGTYDGVPGAAISPDGQFRTLPAVGTVRSGFGIRRDSQASTLLRRRIAPSTPWPFLRTAGRCSPPDTLDKTVRLWDAATAKSFTFSKGHGGPVWSVAFSPDGSQVLTASWDRTMRLWDLKTWPAVNIISPHPTGVRGVAFSPDGRRILSGSGTRVDFDGGLQFAGYDSRVRLWDVASGRRSAVSADSHRWPSRSRSPATDDWRLIGGWDNDTHGCCGSRRPGSPRSRPVPRTRANSPSKRTASICRSLSSSRTSW